MVMIYPNEVTFIIPAFNLKLHRLNNLKFILPKILSTRCKVLLVEQTDKDKSEISDSVNEWIAGEYQDNFSHLLYHSKSKEIHKTGLINWAVKNSINTKYVWVNDVDFYMKYSEALLCKWNSSFIRPYFVTKKLNEKDSEKFISGEKTTISYEDKNSKYISLYGAMAFIFERKEFVELGGMDETIYGWGKEDIEFSQRLEKLKIIPQVLPSKGVHLWHPIEIPNTISNESEQPSDNKDMAVITCYFNWCGFYNPTKHFHRFLRDMKRQEIPLYGVELSLTDAFETKGIDGWIQIKVKKENVCFQKEACLNLVEKHVPKNYQKIAWIDCDLSFTNQNWYKLASKKLDEHKLVQLYTHGYNMDRYGRISTEFPGIMYMYNKLPAEQWFKHSGYPGGGWGARRDLWKHGGLYPYAAMGGGDTIFIYSLYDYGFETIMYENLGIKKASSTDPFSIWRKNIAEYINKDVSYIENKFLHEWHGDKKNRGYTTRHGVLKKIDIRKNLKLNDKGILEIYNLTDSTVFDEIYEYFLGRDEDGFFSDMASMGNLKYKKLYDI
jgi:hypothetical protein